VWIDAQHRLVQVQATEIRYAAKYLAQNGNGSGEGGLQVASRGDLNAPLETLRRSGWESVTTTFSEFGHPVIIKAPSEVARIENPLPPSSPLPPIGGPD
jgi:hypothetical protein